MSKSDTRRGLAEAATTIADTLTNFDALYRCFDSYSGGMASSAGQGERVSTSSPSSPTERQALGRDPAVRARRRFEELAARLFADSEEVRLLARFWLAPADRDGAPEGPPGCSLLAVVGCWEPVVGQVDGRPVGRWARDFHKRTGVLPSRSQAEAHAQGRRINAKAA